MFSLFKRDETSHLLTAESMTRWALIGERKSLRDNDLKLLRITISKRRKEVNEMLEKCVITALEHQRHLDTMNVIEKHALDVVYLRNRERLQELGAPKQRRGQSKLHGIDMGLGDIELEKQADEDKNTDNNTNSA